MITAIKYIPIPIVIFALGLLTTFVVKQWQLRGKMRSNQRFLVFWIDAIREAVEKQAEGLREYADEIKKADAKSIGLTRINIHTDKLKAITAVEMVQTFITNKQSKKK